jgi:hypothetical protein
VTGLSRAGTPRRRPGRPARERGQAIVELALIVPVFLILLAGLLEYGAAIDHHTAMAFAVREGARVGASLGNGGSYPDTVDPIILVAVQRGLTDPILIENITSIDIYMADANGEIVPGKINTYDRDGTLIGTAGWPATARVMGLNGDSIGVRVRYDFHSGTPLAMLLGMFSGSPPPYTTIPMTDRMVMRLEPAP